MRSNLETMTEDFDKRDGEDLLPDVMRSAAEVARRCCVLMGIVAAGHHEPRGPIIGWLKAEELWEYVSPYERRFLESEFPMEQQFVNATWRAEASQALLWALGELPAMSGLTEICSLDSQRAAIPFLGPASDFISKASLRTEEEIRGELDSVYDAHWRVRDAQLKRRPVPDGLNPGVIQERHYALNWLTGYDGQEWDGITTDT
mgnify:CR=1 FL=1